MIKIKLKYFIIFFTKKIEKFSSSFVKIKIYLHQIISITKCYAQKSYVFSNGVLKQIFSYNLRI